MRKKQIDETQLLADATRWFNQKYGESPQNLGAEFIKIWHKPTPFIKTPTVVFAPTEEIGRAFIWEQNVIFRTMGNFWFFGAALFACVVLLTYFLPKQDIVSMVTTITSVLLGLSLCFVLLFLYLARKCKKCEKIHQWNVEVYYPKR